MKRRMDSRSLFALTTMLLLWASAFAGIRMGLRAYSPEHLALLRFIVASAALGGYAIVNRMRMPEWRDIPAIALLGFLGITVYHLALNYGEVTVTAGAASLLIALAPVFMAILAILFLGERLRVWGWLGIAVSFLGGTLIVLGEGEAVRLEPGALLVLLAAFTVSLYNVFQKPYLGKYSPLQFTACSIWAGTLFMLPFFPGLFQAVRAAPLEITLAVVYLGIFPAALAYVLWAYLLSRAPASLAGSFIYLVPALSIFIAWAWLQEVPSLLSLGGGLLSLVGVILVNTRGM